MQIIVNVGQNLIDIAVQHLGDAQAVHELARLNNLSVTATLTVGSILQLPDSVFYNQKTVRYFQEGKYIPATSNNIVDNYGIGYDIIELNLEVA